MLSRLSKVFKEHNDKQALTLGIEVNEAEDVDVASIPTEEACIAAYEQLTMQHSNKKWQKLKKLK
jgi:hypothetical protein